MPHYADLSVSAFLDALAAGTPTPAGGSASAIAGAMGAALLVMVASIPRSRSDAEVETISLAAARDALEAIRASLLALADADAEAYARVMTAYRMPKGAEHGARDEAIQTGLQAATDTPLAMLSAAADALQHALAIARFGAASALSDVSVGIGLLETAAAGAASSVQTNLPHITNQEFRTVANAKMVDASNRVAMDAKAARAALGK